MDLGIGELREVEPEPTLELEDDQAASRSLTEEEFALHYFFDNECSDVAFGD